jgi:hypothetical protein
MVEKAAFIPLQEDEPYLPETIRSRFDEDANLFSFSRNFPRSKEPTHNPKKHLL